MKRKSLPTGRDFLFVEGYGNENPGAFQSPRPLRGATELCFSGGNFNPRAPCGARPVTKINVVTEITFQPTRPLRGATGDSVIFCAGSPDFNPRAPCGARLPFLVVSKGKQAFQPTRPLRGATKLCYLMSRGLIHFNPRAPCGARQQECTNHYAHFCDNRQISDVFAQNAACQGILLLFDAGKPCGFWVRTAQVISARLCFAL